MDILLLETLVTLLYLRFANVHRPYLLAFMEYSLEAHITLTKLSPCRMPNGHGAKVIIKGPPLIR